MIKHLKALNGKVADNSVCSHIQKILLIILNVLLIIAALVAAGLYTRFINMKQRNVNADSFVSTVETIKQVTDNYLDNEKGYADNWANYISYNHMDLLQAMDYIRNTNTNSDRYVHFVDMQTYTAYSVYSNSGDNIARCYMKIKERDSETDRIFIKNMEMMFDAGKDESLLLGKYRDDITQLTVVSVGTKVTLRENDRDIDYLLLRLIPVDSLKKAWVFTVAFQSAEIGMITNTGAYVVQSNSMKANTFIDLIRNYNYPDDYNKSDDFAAELAQNENGLVKYKNSKGEMCYWYYSAFDNNSGIDILGMIKSDVLDATENNWMVVLIICGVLILLIIIDGTHILMINRQLRKTVIYAEQASEAKTQFLSSMSHDIRTPMNAVVGMTQIAKKNINDPQYVSACLDKVTLACNHLITLINDILDISKVESGKMALSPESVQINSLLENIVNIIRPQINDKNIKFDYYAHDIPFDCITADGLRLSQIYMNLLSNAYKYTNKGGHIELEIYEELNDCKNDNVRLVYRVKDDGIGMSDEYMKTMYDSFTRAERSTISKIQGSGLGLAIVKQFTDMMHGTIECQSTEGIGTEFIVRIEFPISRDRANKNDISGIQAEYTKSEFEGMRVLIAEDNDLNYEIVETMLDEYGIICDRAENGSECVKIITSSDDNYYSAILMDIQMPVMNGIEAAKLIRQSAVPYVRNIRIVAVTADAFAEDIQACKDAGMNAHISKPININNVLKILRQIRSNEHN